MKLLIVLLFLSFGFCEKWEREIVVINNNLAFKLMQELSNERTNFLISPFGISSGFGMLYMGARGNTRQEFRNALSYGLTELDDSKLANRFHETIRNMTEMKHLERAFTVANALFVQNDFPILDEYKLACKQYFNGLAINVDFMLNGGEAVRKINEWCRNETNRKIDSIINHVDSNTKLMLINAVYFNSLWQTMFKKKETKKGMFNGFNQTFKVDFMKVKSTFKHTFSTSFNSDIMELPFAHNEASMVIVLPKKRDGLKKLRTMINDVTFEREMKEMTAKNAEIHLPKFNLSTQYNMKNAFMKLGMNDAFTLAADFSGIIYSVDLFANLHLSEVIHHSRLEIGESGIEIGNAMDKHMHVIRRSIQEDNVVFKADHPFAFFICDKRNDMILYAAHVTRF